MTKVNARVRTILPAIVWFGGFFALWEGSIAVFDVQDYILPSPSDFLLRIFTDFDRLSVHAMATGWLIVVGFLAGAVPAVVLGFLISTFPFLEHSLYPLIVFVRSLPKISLAPLLLVWFGFTAFPKIFLAALLTFFPVLVDSIAGFKSIDRRMLHLTRSMGASSWQTFRYIRVPVALPHIFSGLKISIVISVTVVVVVEYLNSNNGLGYVVVRAMHNEDIALMFAALTIAAAIGLALYLALQSSERLLMPWLKVRSDEE